MSACLARTLCKVYVAFHSFILALLPDYAERSRHATVVLVRAGLDTRRRKLNFPAVSPPIGLPKSLDTSYGPEMGEFAILPPVAEPEAKVLIIMTGGTICMQQSPIGLIPARGFLETYMAPRPEFNEGTTLDDLEVKFDDTPGPARRVKSLRTPTSKYGKRVR
jgi:hypothetical protein